MLIVAAFHIAVRCSLLDLLDQCSAFRLQLLPSSSSYGSGKKSSGPYDLSVARKPYVDFENLVTTVSRVCGIA